MAALSIAFTPPYDVHLLRGQSFQIISDGMTDANHVPFVKLLAIGNSDPSTYVDNHPNHQYRFRFSFDETKAPDYGIRISNPVADPRKPDCVITLDASEPVLPKNRIRNFYLIAEVIDTSGTANPDDDILNATALRIHIHNTIDEIWISPDPLTIYKGSYYRSQVYGRYDDNVIAKINKTTFRGNNGSGFQYNITPPVTVEWSSDTSGLISPLSDLIRPQAFSGHHTIKATVAFNGDSQEVRSEVVISDLLTNASSLEVELVSTGSGPGFSDLESIPNVLFISEGFTTDQDLDFKCFVMDYVYDLVSKKITSPFNYLIGAINYWMVFVPSREGGVSTFGERRVYEITNSIGMKQLQGTLIPFVENPGNQAVSRWVINHLLYFVGLPAPFEKNSTPETLSEKWKATTNLSDSQIADLMTNRTDLIEEWKTYAVRGLPELRDTALGVVVHDYTAASKDEAFNLINLDAKRTHRDHLDDFLYGLTNADGNLIGRTFIQSPSSTPDPTLPQGKDRDNIIIITACKRGRAQNENGYMFSTIGEQTVDDLTGDLTRHRISIDPVTMPFKLPNGVKGTITHELCHSFALGDEYGENVPMYSGISVTSPAVSGWDFAQYPGGGSAFDDDSNVQARSDLEIKDADGNRRFQAFRIKWRYHRIRKCGVVAALSLKPLLLTLTVRRDQATQFSIGDSVFVRKRKKNSQAYFVYDRSDDAVAPLGIILGPEPVPPAFMGEVELQSIDATADQITVRTEIGSVNSGNFGTLIVQLETGKAAQLQSVQKVFIRSQPRPGPIYTVFRSATGELEQKALSGLLTITAIRPATRQIDLAIPADFPDYLKILTANDSMLVYQPIDMPAGKGSANYPHAELIAHPVLLHLLANPFPFNTNSQKEEIVDLTTSTRIPSKLVPCCSKRQREIIGLYSGGSRYHGGMYHPAAQCMMRHHNEGQRYVELCAVCRYTLINLIDPTQFAAFDADYMRRKIYPD